jgi:hypothetical protein
MLAASTARYKASSVTQAAPAQAPPGHGIQAQMQGNDAGQGNRGQPGIHQSRQQADTDDLAQNQGAAHRDKATLDFNRQGFVAGHGWAGDR